MNGRTFYYYLWIVKTSISIYTADLWLMEINLDMSIFIPYAQTSGNDSALLITRRALQSISLTHKTYWWWSYFIHFVLLKYQFSKRKEERKISLIPNVEYNIFFFGSAQYRNLSQVRQFFKIFIVRCWH